MIAEPLTLPALSLASLAPARRFAVARTESPFTFDQQVQVHPGAAWRWTVEVVDIVDMVLAGEWSAFLTSAGGGRRVFLLGDPTRDTPQGTVSGNPVVDGGADVRDETLAVRGLDAGLSGAWLPGDLIQLGTGTAARLHEVQTAADSDGSGKAALDVWPPLRASYADGENVIYSQPRGVFRMAQNVAEPKIQPPTIHRIKFEAVEAL